MTQEWVCWKCGATLAASMPVVARTDECAVCRTDLHVCRLCEFFDERVSRQCREPIADEVMDKTRANFCGYFQVRAHAFRDRSASAEPTRAALDALFAPPTPSPSAASVAEAISETERARRQLAELFGDTDTRGKT